MEKIIIYTNEQCPYCKQVKEELTKNEVEFENRFTKDFELAWRDFIAARNWGKTKDGRFVLLDAGALDVTVLSRFLTSKKSIDTINDEQNILQKDWDKLLADRRAAGMGKFVIVLTAGGQGYKILENQKIILDKNK